MRTVRRRAGGVSSSAASLPLLAVVATVAGLALAPSGSSRLVVVTKRTATTAVTVPSTAPPVSVSVSVTDPAPTTKPTTQPTTQPTTKPTTPPPTPAPSRGLTWSPPVLDIARGEETAVSLCRPAPAPGKRCGDGYKTSNPTGRSGPYDFDDEFATYRLPPGVALDASTGEVTGTPYSWKDCTIDPGACAGESGPRDSQSPEPRCVHDAVCEYPWIVCVSAPDGPPREACEEVTVRFHS